MKMGRARCKNQEYLQYIDIDAFIQDREDNIIDCAYELELYFIFIDSYNQIRFRLREV